MSEEKLRAEAVRRRLAGESPEEIAVSLGRTARWVRKWVSRHGEEGHEEGWAEDRSRAPLFSPFRIDDGLRDLVLASRARLVANPRAQYGSLAIQWELRRLGVTPIPPSRTIERVLERAGVSQPRRRGSRYVSKGVPYPVSAATEPGTVHQIDLVGPRHLFGGVEFHALNLIDVGSHEAASNIVETTRPSLLAVSLTSIWSKVGVPQVAQLDNHSNFRGGIPPAYRHFGPVVATCLDLGVTPRFIPLREPWRNGVIEHFNDVWDKASSAPRRSPVLTISEARTTPSSPSTTSITVTPLTTVPLPPKCEKTGAATCWTPATSRRPVSPPEAGSR